VVSVVRDVATLRIEEQYSQIEGASLVGVMTLERRDISGFNNTPQVTVVHVTASALVSTHGVTREESIHRGLHEMAVATTEHPYIVRDPGIGQGEPIILGTAVRVRILVEYWREGTPPEELLQAFPQLSLAQVFDALSYYQDHQTEINILIARNRVDPGLIHESVHGRP
jgi:uncharacterized protein (DUF433 family)